MEISSVHQLQPLSTMAETCEGLKNQYHRNFFFFSGIVTEKYTFAEELTPMR